MHGRNKAEHQKRVSDPTFIKALEKKVKNYTKLTQALNGRRGKEEGNNQETLNLTSMLLQINPDYYTLWNHRRSLLLTLSPHSISTKSEDDLTVKALKKNPKCYGAWMHRKWTRIRDREQGGGGREVLEDELLLTSNFLRLDERNFHCWNYRRFVVSMLISHLGVKGVGSDVMVMLDRSGFGVQVEGGGIKGEGMGGIEGIKDVVQKEFDFTTSLISSNFSNYSAYHYRSKLLPLSLLLTKKDGVSVEEHRLEAVKKELGVVREAVFTEPADQSSWWYQRYLYNLVKPPLTSARDGTTPLNTRRYAELLQDETAHLRELIKEEGGSMGGGGSKWALNSLYFILCELDDIVGMGLGVDAREVLEVLKIQDGDKFRRYWDMGKVREARETTVLFHYQERDSSCGDKFIELKRESYKDHKDKSMYVSWFWVKKDGGGVERLGFRNWDKVNGVRMFEQGMLTNDETGAGWVVNGDEEGEMVELLKRKVGEVGRDLVESCVQIW